MPWKWSYTYGVFMAGSAYLYNATGDDKWKVATENFVTASSYFFDDSNIMTETTCVSVGKCNQDQRSFRSLFSRFLGLTATLIPETSNQIIQGWMYPSAMAAAQSCSGDGKATCGQSWSLGGWDGIWGLGEQMGALECILSLVSFGQLPLTPETGASDADSDVNAGKNSSYY